MFLMYAFVILLYFPLWIMAQDCRFFGQSCSDDYACCGGCCLSGICKDNCRTVSTEDPCTDRYCPEGQVCYTYQPPGCKGCGPLIECRTLSVPEELKTNKTLTHHHKFSAAAITRLQYCYLIFVIIYFVL